MLAAQRPRLTRRTPTARSAPLARAARVTGHVLTAGAVLAGVLVPAGAAGADRAARPGGGLKRVSYLGYAFLVPVSWPVISLARHPRDCVRFNLHAVYLGAPGTNETCPSRLLGTTEAVLIQPGPVGVPLQSVENPVARQVTVTAPGIRLLATLGADPARIYQVLASASLPAPRVQMPDPVRLEAVASPAAPAAPAPAALSAAVANYRGPGFDACAAPSAAYMRAWRRWSPYRAVGIYIGGADRSCDQRNLTRSWVLTEARAGWRFIPMYAGPQAAFGELKAPGQQGARAAADAVAQAERLGFGRPVPIYYDMEGYQARHTGAVLRFLSAWTNTLHHFGYLSGVYSSSRSAVVDLAREYSRRSFAIPDIIYDALWNGRANVADRSIRSGEWPEHRRIHQYLGNIRQTYGHDTINIDKDFLDVDLPVPDGTPQASQAVSLADGVTEVFYPGRGGSLWRDVHSFVTGWSPQVNMGGADSSVPSAVSTASGAVDVFYKGADRYLWEASFRPGPGWGPARRLTGLGLLGGAPRAVSEASGIVDVFWRGAPHRQLWHARFVPGHGWSGPQRLGAGLASYPSPVAAGRGTVAAFWKGRDRHLWYVASRPGNGWSSPARLRTGPLGGPVRATAQSGGLVGVVWRGQGRTASGP